MKKTFTEVKKLKIISLRIVVKFNNSKDAAKFVKDHYLSSRTKSIAFVVVSAAADKFTKKLEDFKMRVKENRGRIILACDDDHSCGIYNTYFATRGW